MLSLLLLAAIVVETRTLLAGAGAEYGTLEAAVAASHAGDTIQLADTHYELSATLVVAHALTIETPGDAVPAIVRSTSADVDVVFAVNANDVALRNLIIGRSANERAIDVFVSAGTQTTQSSLFATTQYGGGGDAGAPTRAVSKRLLDRTGVADDAVLTNRAIRGFTLENVDFAASASATNLAFDTGAYIGVRVARCKFGQRDLTDAIVTVAGARFADSAPLEFNAFDKARLNLSGYGLTLGTNYWPAAVPRPSMAVTYCVDRQCSMLGPVVDGDAPTAQAYGSIGAALAAGVRSVLVTAATVEWGDELSGPITMAGTTVRGQQSEHCAVDDAVPLVTVRHPIISTGSALVAVSDLRFELLDSVTTSAFAYTDGSEQGDVLFERVSMLGDNAEQTMLTLDSRSVALTISRCVMIGGGVGVALRAGALVVSDSAFETQSVASISVSGSGAGTGLRVSGSEFGGSPRGSIVFERSVASAQMLPISVSCSRFVMAPFVEPADCLRNAQQCANALRYNTFIEILEPTPLVANRRFLAHGGNHVERVAASQLSEFTQLAHSGGDAFSFAFVDKQGRFGRVRADVALQQHAANHYVLASNVPMRQECFAESVPGQRVVSGLFSLITDAPARCVSLALQFTVVQDDRDNTTASASDDVAVYDVKHLGNNLRGSAVWQRAASNVVLNKAASQIVVEASSGAGALMQAVVVAQRLTDKESAVLLSNGESVGVPRANQRFCVACGGDELPAYVLDERCGGGVSGAHVFTDFDAAMAAANEAGKSDSVVLLVYGQKCTTAQCNTRITAQQLTLEGFSVSSQSALRRPARCAADVPMLTLAAPSVTVRYMLLASDTPLATAVPRCAVELSQNDGRLSFSTISGGVCVSEADAQIVGNEVTPSGLGEAPSVLLTAQSSNALVQSNSLKSGNVVLLHGARGAAARIDRNTFGPTAAIENDAAVLLTGNTFVDRPADAVRKECLLSTEGASSLTSTGDLFGAHCQLLFSGGGKVRLTGKKAAAPWADVQVKLADTGDVRIANVDLRGANAQIVLLDPGAKDVVLYDVGIDTEQSTLADTLIGRPLARTPCSGEHEPALGGFALTQSLLLDVKTRAMLLGGAVPKLKTTEFISPVDGRIVRCSAQPEADYCRCIAAQGVPLTTTTRRTQPPSTPVVAEVQEQTATVAAVVETEPLPDEPLEDFDSGLDAVLPQTLARVVKKVLPQAVRKFAVLQVDSTSLSDSRRGGLAAGWIVGIVLLVLVVLVAICVCCCFCYPGFSSTTRTTRRVVEEEDGSEVVSETTTTSAHRGAPQRRAPSKSPGRVASSMGVVLDTPSTATSASNSGSQIKLRKVTTRGVENV